MKILNIVGARPNFIKIAPLMREMLRHPDITPILVHTGQHYDVVMAQQFFTDLEIPKPHVSLEVGSGSHAHQTAEVMKRLEPILLDEAPDIVLVVGDVNSTVAAALTAAKLQIPVAHVEAGLRSFDRSMPEEINRVVTDCLSQYLFVTEESGLKNLAAEGVDTGRIYFVGNVMIDSLVDSRRLWECTALHQKLGLKRGEYGVMTLHRPANVDNPAVFQGLISAIAHVASHLPIVFPVHPRTRKHLEQMDGENARPFHRGKQAPDRGIYCTEPLGYLDFMSLVAGAKIVLTDSGGIQEETTVLGVPCLTLRENTERPITVTHGTNRLVGLSPDNIRLEAEKALSAPRTIPSPPPLWDGHAARRIVSVLKNGRDNSAHSSGPGGM